MFYLLIYLQIESSTKIALNLKVKYKSPLELTYKLKFFIKNYSL